eukprot:TRINITY_DN14848_c0_g1_i1.p1 TRINITY_DN14848_c0_g1~~TRINITY_DN14848_c0_g1_i1.p1  ORF type:complete len:645 (+),score=128.86 TRINITY_DN14848_c0_g1_i1:68-2002(+)
MGAAHGDVFCSYQVEQHTSVVVHSPRSGAAFRQHEEYGAADEQNFIPDKDAMSEEELSSLMTREGICHAFILREQKEQLPSEDNLLAHRYEPAHLVRPDWCHFCGRFLAGLFKQGQRCSACDCLACHHCSDLNRVCIAQRLLYVLSDGQAPFEEDIEAASTNSAVILYVAGQHAPFLQYASSQLWMDSSFLCKLADLAGSVSGGNGKALKAQIGLTVRTMERELKLDVVDKFVNIVSSISEEAVTSKVGSAFILNLLAELEEGSERVFAVIRQRIADSEMIVRLAAVSCLAQLSKRGDEKATSAVVRRLKDSSALVRVAAVRALATLAEKDSQPVLFALVQRLSDIHSSVRVASVETLAVLCQASNSRVINALVQSLSDKCPEVRAATIEVLPKFGKSAQSEILIAVTSQTKSKNDSIRNDAVKHLLQTIKEGNAQVISQIPARLQNANWAVKVTVCNALPAHLSAADADVRLAALCGITKLSEKRDSQAAAAIAACLRDVDTRVAEEAWTCIASRLDERDPDVRRIALESLAAVAPKTCSKQVVAAVTAHLGDSNRHVQAAAIASLAALAASGDYEAVLAWCACLKDEDPEFRIATLEALPCMVSGSHEEILAAVQSCTEDADANVRLAAQDTLAALTSDLEF